MGKPIYYLWENDFPTREELDAAKEKFRKTGFRAVIFLEGHKSRNIHEGMKSVIQNHIRE